MKILPFESETYQRLKLLFELRTDVTSIASELSTHSTPMETAALQRWRQATALSALAQGHSKVRVGEAPASPESQVLSGRMGFRFSCL
jgi:hypothetical protein